jgi:flagellar export protein FliJ
MKPRDTVVRLRSFQVEERRRRLEQISGMIAEFERVAAELDSEIAAEERRTGITDPDHFAYSTYARAARTRRDNLHASVRELKEQRAEAEAELANAELELERMTLLEERIGGRARSGEREDARTVGAGVA